MTDESYTDMALGIGFYFSDRGWRRIAETPFYFVCAIRQWIDDVQSTGAFVERRLIQRKTVVAVNRLQLPATPAKTHITMVVGDRVPKW